ncbi:uncharacterized protein LOC133531757 isoform X2 [Cydia pomonella]|nr:uncharacterized protein LOC133531757 isoform X2 [Cydia pomonella]
MWCISVKMGIFVNGEFNDTRMIEWMKIPIDMKLLTETQANEIGEECYYSVYRLHSDKDMECKKANDLLSCFSGEMRMIHYDTYSGSYSYAFPYPASNW